MSKAVGRRIKLARERAGLSQEDLGDLLRVTRSSVSLWEKGRSVPTGERARKLAEVFKLFKRLRRKMPGRVYRRDFIGRCMRLIAVGFFDDFLASLGYAKKHKRNVAASAKSRLSLTESELTH
jgi:transcriptional regulator with XRE-family HTH domain